MVNFNELLSKIVADDSDDYDGDDDNLFDSDQDVHPVSIVSVASSVVMLQPQLRDIVTILHNPDILQTLTPQCSAETSIKHN